MTVQYLGKTQGIVRQCPNLWISTSINLVISAFLYQYWYAEGKNLEQKRVSDKMSYR